MTKLLPKMVHSSPTPYSYIFSLLLSLVTLVYSQSTGTTTVDVTSRATSVTPTAVTSDAATTGAKEYSVIIIDKEWTQFFIGGVPIIGAVVVLGCIYQFLWVPWWRAKMKVVEKEYNRLEKERLGQGRRAGV